MYISSLVAELRDIIRDLWFHDSPTHSPISFLTCMWTILPKFYGSEQHDTHEFLRSLLDRLNVEFKSSRTRQYRNTVQGLFQGIMESEITCQNCESTFHRKNEPFLDISLDLPSTEEDELSLDGV